MPLDPIGTDLWLAAASQVGSDLLDGLLDATAPPTTVRFEGGSMGMGLGPASGVGNIDAEDIGDEDEDEEEVPIIGAQVTGVDEGSAAAEAGVEEGWRLAAINGVDVTAASFWDVDALFDTPPPWEVEFDVASSASNLYAVEIPAEELLSGLGALPTLTQGLDSGASTSDRSPSGERGAQWDWVEPGAQLAALQRWQPFVWAEPFARLFLGDPGSVTCLHVDLLPQLEFCHALAGFKVIGAASWADTTDVLAQHVDPDTGEATVVPSDEPLSAAQQALLGDPRLNLLAVGPGDIAVFSSAAAHFATNGADAPSAALYHGGLTPAAIPRLCADAAVREPFTPEERAGEYAHHLTARQLVGEYRADGAGTGLLGADVFRCRAGLSNGGGEPAASLSDRDPRSGFDEGNEEVSAMAQQRLAECVAAMETALGAAQRGESTLPQWPGESELFFWGYSK